jgi:hypothetical protein
MKLCRIILILSFVGFGYSVGVLFLINPWYVIFPCLFVVGLRARKGPRSLTAHGTARWANKADLAGMLDGRDGDA